MTRKLSLWNTRKCSAFAMAPSRSKKKKQKQKKPLGFSKQVHLAADPPRFDSETLTAPF